MMLESKKVQIQPSLHCGMENLKYTNISQVKASSVVVECDDIEFFDWSLHNSRTCFLSCDDIGKCPMLKVVIERAIEKLPHYDLAGNLFNVDHGIYKHQFL